MDASTPAAPAVVINEVMFADASGPDWIEIYNADADAADLSGWVVSNAGFAAGDAYAFPDETVLEPGQYITLYSNQAPTLGELVFELATDRDSVLLFAADGSAVDAVTWEPMGGWPFTRLDGMSYGRIPNGSGEFQLLFDDDGGGGTPATGTPASPSTDGENVAVPFCGNGVADQVSEGCDDGNDAPDDGCTACVVTPYCGNGVVDQDGETCDDGNDATGDGCAACATEDGWVCFQAANACYDVDETSGIVLNEVLSKDVDGGPDWVELHNVSGATIAGGDLNGLCLTDDHELVDPAAPPCNNVTACPDSDYACTSATATLGVCLFMEAYVLNGMTDLPADGYLSLTQDASFTFGFGANDAVFLYSSCDPGTATLIDVLDFEELPDGQSFGRWTDSNDVEGYHVMVIPTQDGANELCGGDQTVPILESTEQCDDGNNVPGDGCDATCKIE